MTRRPKDPLRTLSDEERTVRTPISRAQREPASHVARATILVAVAAGQPDQTAARAAGRTSAEAVAHLVTRFHQVGFWRLRLATAVAACQSLGSPNANGAWPKCTAPRIARRMAPPVGR